MTGRLGALFGLTAIAPAHFPQSVSGPHGPIPLVVRTYPHARGITLRVCASSRSIRLTLPPGASGRRVAAFLAEQQGWIDRQVRLRLPRAIPFAPGLVLPFGDGVLHLHPGTGRLARLEENRLLVPGEGALFEGRVRRWLAAEALRLLEPETRALALSLPKPVQKVRVGDFRSRWGSCAADGRIAYNWRLVLAPGHVRRAVVAHEVAHLAVPDHSADFWNLAAQLLGESHAPSRAWLRTNGPMLHSFGASQGLINGPPPARQSPARSA